MKNLIFGFLVLLAFTGCEKSGIKPTTPIDTDAVIHTISFSAPTQFAATSVIGDTLKTIFYENVSLLIPADGLNLSYALHLKEDFTSSALINFNFTTVDAYGDVTYDWVDDNLNNVTAKTEKDTVINGKNVAKITVQRPFTFSETYTSAQLAINEQDSLLKRTTDKINFSSYVYFGKTYPATSTSTPIYYVKAN
jgi:hypothetical protein